MVRQGILSAHHITVNDISVIDSICVLIKLDFLILFFFFRVPRVRFYAK